MAVRQLVKTPVDEKKAILEDWKMLRHMLDVFWRRWIVDYLPMISRRSKWFQDVAPITDVQSNAEGGTAIRGNAGIEAEADGNGDVEQKFERHEEEDVPTSGSGLISILISYGF